MPSFRKISYHNGVIWELFVDDQNVIMPWGVEFADSSAFFSLEDGFGYRYRVLEHEVQEQAGMRVVRQLLRMHEGLVCLELKEWMETSVCLRRSARLECLEDTTLMDFVLRYRFSSAVYPHGSIADRFLPYRNTKVYHQYPVQTASVGNSEYSVRVSVLNSVIPDDMFGYMYLRDGDGYWVLHVRMLPRQWDREVIKLCSRWFDTKPLPDWATRALLRIPGVRKAIWYRGERNPYKNRFVQIFSPNAYPMVRLKKGETLLWDVACMIEPPGDHSALRKDDGGHVWP